VVASYRRPQFLDALVGALADQTLPHPEYEVVIVDNGSADATWDRLRQLVAASPARLAAVRLEENRGPGGGRNLGATLIRSPYLAFTDDDCLPTPGWLAAMLAALEDGNDVVQGRVEAAPAEQQGAGPWDHTKWITSPTPFFETCNVGYRTSAFTAVHGFDEGDSLTAQRSGRAFGEDALLAWNVQKSGGRATFTSGSVVYHRVVPSDFTGWLRDQRNLVGFPGLGNRSPLVARWFWHRIFLSRGSAQFDLAVACVLAAALARRPWMLLGAAPWLSDRWPQARARGGASRTLGLVRLAQLAVADGVALGSLLQGSVRHRRVLL
jgi:glycosyltransferase involved in cell wall biosynthesis